MPAILEAGQKRERSSRARPKQPGIALRFAGVLRHREAKTANKADTFDTVLALRAET